MRYAIFCTLLASAVAAFAAPCTPNLDHRKIDHTAIQNIQKDKVNSGKELWRLDPKEVAAREAAALDPAYKGAPGKTPVQFVKGDDRVQVFRYRNAAGASYEITLKKFDWLLPYSGIYKMMMWTVTDVKRTCGR
jgi:hypothetical protein